MDDASVVAVVLGVPDNTMLLSYAVTSGMCICIANNGYLRVRPAFCHVACLPATLRQNDNVHT